MVIRRKQGALISGFLLTAAHPSLAQKTQKTVSNIVSSTHPSKGMQAIGGGNLAETYELCKKGSLPPVAICLLGLFVVLGFFVFLYVINRRLDRHGWEIRKAISEPATLTSLPENGFANPIVDDKGMPINVQVMVASVSHLIAVAGLVMLILFYLGFGIISLYHFGLTCEMPKGIDGATNFLFVGLIFFAPYFINKASGVLSRHGRRPPQPKTNSETPGNNPTFKIDQEPAVSPVTSISASESYVYSLPPAIDEQDASANTTAAAPADLSVAPTPDNEHNNPLPVPFYSLMATDESGFKDCLSASCFMLAQYWGALQADERGSYERIREKYGNRMDISAHLSALKSLGLVTAFHTDGGIPDILKKEIDAGRPVAVAWLHYGPASTPYGGGHWSVVTGYDNKGFWMNDPYGQCEVKGGGYPNDNNGNDHSGSQVQYMYSEWIPRWMPEGSTGWYLTCYAES